ncbi:MAG: hypothetical protein MI746_17725, partial [Pseudomonadales bacterium]|nr:hypothetical protein [Pseudomonadales bacterium]
MMKPVSLRLFGLTSLSLAVAAPFGYAQSPDHEIEEIVVQGQFLYRDQINALRTPTPILDVPQSLSIVTAEQIT